MSLADKIVFTRDHIEKYKFNASSELAEQAVHCLELVSQLANEEFDFKFKGGNSLLVLLDEPRRFSIDVDIATGESKERVEEVVKRIVEKHDVFLRYEKREHKTKPWLPISSFYFYYKSHFVQSGENNIMFDVVLKESPYPGKKVLVACTELYRSTQEVYVPTVSGLIGDKMLVLGPKTLGIPLGKNKEGHRLKQSNDISRLLDEKPDIEMIRKSIQGCLQQENELQKVPCTLEQVYDDTMAMCKLTADNLKMPEVKNEVTVLDELVRGVEPFASHLFSRDYSWKDLQIDLAKVAICFTGIMCNVSQEQFFKALDVELMNFETKNSKVNYYWKIVSEWKGSF